MLSLLVGEKTLKASTGFFNDHQEVVDLLAAGKINIDGFCTAKIKLQDVVEKGFKELHDNGGESFSLCPPGSRNQRLRSCFWYSKTHQDLGVSVLESNG